MKKSLTVGCVIMASGLSRRFGTNKLLADFCGQPMLCRAFAATATPGIAARIVVTRSEEVQALCRAHGVPVLLHSLPGRNDTVRLGLSALLAKRNRTGDFPSGSRGRKRPGTSCWKSRSVWKQFLFGTAHPTGKQRRQRAA